MIMVILELPQEQLINMSSNFILPVELPGLIFSAFVIDKFGRKLSMAVMFFVCCIFLLPLVVHQSRAVTVVLLFGARICITGTFAVVFIYAPEVNQRELNFHPCLLFIVWSLLVFH